jgi:MFS family permease
MRQARRTHNRRQRCARTAIVTAGVSDNNAKPRHQRTAIIDALSLPTAAALAPFRIRSFRFQWPSNLTASWAFEMEVLILGWYILIETGSVLLLTAFGSLQWVGTLVAPLFGVVGDRIGHRAMLCLMRAFYAAQALVLLVLAWTGRLDPLSVFIVSAAMSMVRPSDNVMRFALIGQIMPAPYLMGAMSIERMTSDSARVVGALTGAGMIASFGMAPAYVVIAGFYLTSFALTLAIAPPLAGRAASGAALMPVRSSPWHDLLDAFRYVRRTPLLLAAMWLAFLVNLTAYPMTLGLLPYVAKEIHRTDQTGLGYLAASFAFGGLVGSLILTHRGHAIASGRWMLVFAAAWYFALLVFAYAHSMPLAIAALLAAGCAQSFSLVPMSAVLLRHSEERYRGRVVGIRMFAIYGLPLGLLVAGPLIQHCGFAAMTTLYCALGLALTAAIGLYWRREVWLQQAPVNRVEA